MLLDRCEETHSILTYQDKTYRLQIRHRRQRRTELALQVKTLQLRGMRVFQMLHPECQVYCLVWQFAAMPVQRSILCFVQKLEGKDVVSSHSPMQRTLLTRYPACTNPAMPVLAAATNPPPNRRAGIAYNHGYSGGSVGPINYKQLVFCWKQKHQRLNMSSMRFVTTNPPDTLTNAKSTEIAPRNSGIVLGR